jgi:hypothetical protein
MMIRVIASARRDLDGLSILRVTGDRAGRLLFEFCQGGYRIDQAEIGHELARMGEAMDVAQCADRDHGGDQLKAAEGHVGLDGGLEPPVFQEACMDANNSHAPGGPPSVS